MNTPARPKLLPALLLGVGLALGGAALTVGQNGAASALARTSFDLLHVLDPSRGFVRSNSPVAIVYLDLESHLRLRQDPAERWDRALHARLIRRLTEAGARAVVFDVVFDTPWPQPAVDLAFADAIRGHGRVVLAAERHRAGQATGTRVGFEVRGLNRPTPVLRDAALRWGAAELAVDSDFVAREALAWLDSPDQPSLARAAASALGEPVSAKEAGPGKTWIRYYGPPLTLPHTSYLTALDPEAMDDSWFRDRVVFVGSRPMISAFGGRRDELRHPFSGWSGGSDFMPGVEVHATQFLNALRGDGLRRCSAGTEAGLIATVGLVLGILLGRWRPAPGALLAGAIAVGGWAAAEAAFALADLWFPWLVVSLVLAPGGWLAAAALHTRDWHRQRRRYEDRRRADARRIEHQATLIERARDVILVLDLQGRVQYANPSARRLLVPDPTSGEAPPTLPLDDFAGSLTLLLAHGEWSGILRCGSGSPAMPPRLLESRATLLRSDAGEAESILIIGTDVTDQRRLEEDFLGHKWEAVGSLAGGMAHDLNNTLAPALLGLQVLRRAEPREENRRILAMIESHTRRGTETVQQVLGFLRGEGAPVGEVDPCAVVRELETLVRASFPPAIRVASLLPPRVGHLRGNATQLHQALLNLCLNARDAMPRGGELTFAVDDVDLSAAEAAQWRGGRAGRFILIAVTDTGSGIPADRIDRIFEPLYTTKDDGRGTGLGLASVLRIVRQHDGFVGVSSEVGAGSSFEIYLPRLDPSPGATDPTDRTRDGNPPANHSGALKPDAEAGGR